MTAADYDDVLGLWQNVEGVGLSSADSREHNEGAVACWRAIGFTGRAELIMMSIYIGAEQEKTVNAEGR